MLGQEDLVTRHICLFAPPVYTNAGKHMPTGNALLRLDELLRNSCRMVSQTTDNSVANGIL